MKTTLPDAAQAAWNAFQLMRQTKAEHIELLERLEAKRELGHAPTRDEEARLEALLSVHDAQVKRFSSELRSLQEGDAAAHAALIEHLSLWSDATGAGRA